MTDERYEKAKKRVEEIKGFYTHLIVYVVINIGLFILNLVTTRGEWWFYWPLMGWGVGILFHGLGVFVFSRFPGKQWEDKKIKEIMDQDKENK